MENTKLFTSILLVEDDPSHALLIKRALRDFCEELNHAEGVSVALEFLSKNDPELIITDLNLPDSTNCEHVGKFSSCKPLSPIIVLTSSTALNDAVQAMKHGARDFVVKNFDGEFKDILHLALTRVQRSIESEKEKRKLQHDMELLRAAIALSSDAFAILSASGKKVFSNPAFELFVEFCGGDSLDLKSFFSEKVKQSQELTESIYSRLQNMPVGSVWNTEVGFDKTIPKAFDLSLSVISLAQSEQPGYVLWIRDISEQKRREKFQREILSTTTHDLKGPLGAVALSSELLQGMLPPGEKPYEIALRIGSSAQGAINLIDEFLSARRIQEGTFILRPEEQVLDSVILELSENYETIAKARGIELQIEYPEGLSACVDRMGVIRALGNLLSNALKFTPKGGRVSLKLSQNYNGLTIVVSDTGMGMETSELQTIFDRYSRLSKHEQVEGTGLGLFVVRSIVDAHGGRIEVSSQVGAGTTFELNFPKNPPVNERGQLILLDFA